MTSSRVNVVIPTKSNFTGLAELLSDLSLDPFVGTVCIVADGQAAFDALPDPPEHIVTITAPEGFGIQHLWLAIRRHWWVGWLRHDAAQ